MQAFANSERDPNRERGMFLVIITIVMLVMVLTGLLVIERSMLVGKEVRNDQQGLIVYQVAYNELEAQLDSLEANTGALSDAITAEQTLIDPAACFGNRVCQGITLRYLDRVPPPAGFDLGSTVALRFEMDSMATIEGTGVVSDQTLFLASVRPVAEDSSRMEATAALGFGP